MLESEMERCLRVVERINAELEKLPRGTLGQRKVKSGGKEYIYPCLKFREEGQVKLQHLSVQQAEELRPDLEKRKRLQRDLLANRKRIHTINNLLQKG
jgi:hypothetical protein